MEFDDAFSSSLSSICPSVHASIHYITIAISNLLVKVESLSLSSGVCVCVCGGVSFILEPNCSWMGVTSVAKFAITVAHAYNLSTGEA